MVLGHINSSSIAMAIWMLDPFVLTNRARSTQTFAFLAFISEAIPASTRFVEFSNPMFWKISEMDDHRFRALNCWQYREI